MIFHFLYGLVCWLDGGAFVHCGTDHCFADHTAARLCFPFCCRLELLCTVVTGIQVDGLCSMGDIIVVRFQLCGFCRGGWMFVMQVSTVLPELNSPFYIACACTV